MADFRVDPLINPQDAPDSAPLRESHEANQLETELKGVFLAALDAFIRPGERDINTIGTPHLGSFTQIERAVKAEGLSLYRRADESAMRYLFRAWRARNPKRGIHMLRCYLQLLWPGEFLVEQLYQLKAAAYPTNLGALPDPSRFRTSRVRVAISSDDITGADVQASIPSMRSVVPARIVLEFALLTQSLAGFGVACAMVDRPNFAEFEGEFGSGPGVTVLGQLVTVGGTYVNAS